MAARINLDMDALRTFVTGFELGSFTKAAERLGRSQSAISTQLRKLEEQVGKPLVQKTGRSLALTADGESVLSYAKRILDMNDEIVDRMQSPDFEGWVRLGMPQDFAESWLPDALGRFSRAHPKVRIKVFAEHKVILEKRLQQGELDLALLWGACDDVSTAKIVADLPINWIGLTDWPGVASLGAEPVPLIAFEPPCLFRNACIAALDKAGIPWRIVFSSPSVASHWAAVKAGLGIAMRTSVGMPSFLSILDPIWMGLPTLPTIALSLQIVDSEPSKAVLGLAEILRGTLGGLRKPTKLA